MREYDEHIRLNSPMLQRAVILVAVIVAVPVVLWTITAFVRAYVARRNCRPSVRSPRATRRPKQIARPMFRSRRKPPMSRPTRARRFSRSEARRKRYAASRAADIGSLTAATSCQPVAARCGKRGAGECRFCTGLGRCGRRYARRRAAATLCRNTLDAVFNHRRAGHSSTRNGRDRNDCTGNGSTCTRTGQCRARQQSAGQPAAPPAPNAMPMAANSSAASQPADTAQSQEQSAANDSARRSARRHAAQRQDPAADPPAAYRRLDHGRGERCRGEHDRRRRSDALTYPAAAGAAGGSARTGTGRDALPGLRPVANSLSLNFDVLPFVRLLPRPQPGAAFDAHRPVAFLLQGAKDFVGMRAVARLHGDVELGAFGRYVEKHPVVFDAENIGAEIPSRLAIWPNTPGRSGIVMRNDTMRFSRSSSRTTIEARMRGSILPPHRIRPTLRPAKRSGAASIAARPAAPAPSAMVFCSVRNAFTARSISASSTRMMSLTSSRTIGKVRAPALLTAMPSASVAPPVPRAVVKRIPHRRIERGLDTDDLDIGFERPRRDRIARRSGRRRRSG